MSRARAGYAFEYLLARTLCDRADSRLSTDSVARTRADHHRMLASFDPEREDHLASLARTVVDGLPGIAAHSPVDYARSCTVPGQVWDIAYDAISGERVLLSAKTALVEDKCLRFNAPSWHLPGVAGVIARYIDSSDAAAHRTVAQAIDLRGADIATFQHEVAMSLASAARGESADAPMWRRWEREQLIGAGGYFKNTPDGLLLEYPAAPSGSYTLVEPSDVTVRAATVSYPMRLCSCDDDVLGEYAVTARVKLKDGKSKIARVSPLGVAANVALTATVTPV